MKFSTVAVAALASSAQAISNYADTSCADKGVHLIALGGEYTTQGNLSLLTTLAQKILDAIPGSNMYQIPYTQGALPPDDIRDATPLFSQHVIDYAASCPNTRMVSIGYSIGAAIIMNTYCGGVESATYPSPLDPTYRPNILANIVYGDPTFALGMRSAVGTCTQYSGHIPRVLPGKCYPFGRKTKSYCDANDPQCCGSPAQIGDPNVHFTYPSIYDDQALGWVLAKWHYYKKHNKDE